MFWSPTSLTMGEFLKLLLKLVFFYTGISSTSTTGCKVWLLFSCDCDVLLIRGAEVSFDILDGECVG